jgi:hypothetical protein
MVPDELKAEMFTYITAEYLQVPFVCYDTILDWRHTTHHLAIFPDALRHLIRRTSTSTTVVSVPMDAKRCCVTVEASHGHLHQLSQEIEDVSAALIVNADESEFQDTYEM